MVELDRLPGLVADSEATVDDSRERERCGVDAEPAAWTVGPHLVAGA